MATDVSGTIHIIAEVMGDASSPVSPGQGSVGSPNKRLKDTSKTLKIMGVNIGKLIKILTVGGLLKLSQNISNTLSGFFQILGALVDLFMIPFVPAFVRALGVLYPILGYLARLSTGEKNMGDIWGDLGDWWGKQVEEEGGVWGAIKTLAGDISAVAFLAGFLMLADPTGVVWTAGKFITYNLFSAVNFSRNFILDAFGLRTGLKGKNKTPIRQWKADTPGQKVRKTISTLRIKELFTPKSQFFPKSSIIGKAWLTRVFGFVVNLVPFLGGAKWKALAKLTSAFIIASVVVGVAWLMHWLFPFDDPDYIEKQIKQSQDEGNAKAKSLTGWDPTFVQNDAKRTNEAIRKHKLEQYWDKQQEKINRELATVR